VTSERGTVHGGAVSGGSAEMVHRNEPIVVMSAICRRTDSYWIAVGARWAISSQDRVDGPCGFCTKGALALRAREGPCPGPWAQGPRYSGRRVSRRRAGPMSSSPTGRRPTGTRCVSTDPSSGGPSLPVERPEAGPQSGLERAGTAAWARTGDPRRRQSACGPAGPRLRDGLATGCQRQETSAVPPTISLNWRVSATCPNWSPVHYLLLGSTRSAGLPVALEGATTED